MVGLIMDSNQYSRARDITVYVPRILSPFQNLAPTLPKMQPDH